MTPGRLRIEEREIRRHGPGNALAVLWRQWRAERLLRGRGIHFRTTDPTALARAYAAMSAAEFEAINGRQDWANWRTIPRAMNGQVPDRPLLVLDLGCGTGSSTQVLAFYCPVGSRIVGYELAEPLIPLAQRRTYRHHTNIAVDVRFCCQGVTEPLQLPEGSLVTDGSVDLINASGVVGHHLDELSIRPLLNEIQRVMKEDGVVTLDVGPTMNPAVLSESMASKGFQCRGHHKSWPGDPTGQLVFVRE